MEVQLKQHNHEMSSCMVAYNVALYKYFIVDGIVIEAFNLEIKLKQLNSHNQKLPYVSN